MAWAAGLITLAIGIMAFVAGYRASAQWLKNDPPYKLSDQADTLPEAAGLIGLLLPRSLKAAWVALCALAVVTLSGAFHFFAVGGAFAKHREDGILANALLYLCALTFWIGMMFGCGTAYERMIRVRKRSGEG